MQILSVAFPLLPAGPSSGGGAEQILYLLERGLVEAGHNSVVVAAAGTQICGELLAGPAAVEDVSDATRREAHLAHGELIQGILSSRTIDIVHFHGLDFFSYIPSERYSARMLATLHLPVDWYPVEIFDIPQMHFNCVSKSQAKTVSDRGLAVIANGVDVERYRHLCTPRDYLLLISRICPEKGVDIALRVAHRLDLPLVVAGPVHPFAAHQQYFAESVQPLLDAKRTYIGSVGLDKKIRLLAGARALLVPSLAAETSSLVAMEAAAAGTPVIAFRAGALPEVVDEGRTGFVVGNEEEMAAAVLRSKSISPGICQETARMRFDRKRMVQDYLDLYAKILDA